MCALDRLQNKYLRLENRSPQFIQSAHYRKLLCQNPGKDPTWGSPSSPTDLNKGCAIFYVIISFISLLLLILFAFAVVTIVGKVPFSLSWTRGSCL